MHSHAYPISIILYDYAYVVVIVLKYASIHTVILLLMLSTCYLRWIAWMSVLIIARNDIWVFNATATKWIIKCQWEYEWISWIID